jgi:hypothetical protein
LQTHLIMVAMATYFSPRFLWKEDNLFLYIIIYGVTIIFLKFLTAIFLVTRTYMVSRTHTYNTIVQINLAAE